MATGIYLSIEEMDALYAVPALAQRLYMLAIRPTMDFNTGVCGKRSRISWPGLARSLRVEASPGIAEDLPTRNQLRKAAAWLEKVGLIVLESEGRQLIIRCLMARMDSAVSNKENKGRTTKADQNQTIVDKPEALESKGQAADLDAAMQQLGDNLQREKGTVLRVSEKEKKALSATSDKTFQMVWNWAPFDVGKFSDDLVLEGIDWESLAAEVRELIRVEFVSYWMARGAEYSQAVWEHKFAGAVKYQVGRGVQRLQVTQQGVQG